MAGCLSIKIGNDKQETPLHMAVFVGSIELIDLFFGAASAQRGPNRGGSTGGGGDSSTSGWLDVPDQRGNTPLLCVAFAQCILHHRQCSATGADLRGARFS